jgi:hypothetical protein
MCGGRCTFCCAGSSCSRAIRAPPLSTAPSWTGAFATPSTASCGYRVHRDEEAQWAGITAVAEDVPLPRMKLDETIVVLVLAAHWQDEVNVGAVEGRATVVTTLNTLYDRYREMARPPSSTAISSTRFRDLLKELGQRSLVDVGDFDNEEQDCEVAIRPMIKLVSGSDALQRIERYARHEEVRSSSQEDDEP